jgi:hypothetical protein
MFNTTCFKFVIEDDDDEYENVGLECNDRVINQIRDILYSKGLSNDEKVRRVVELL